MSLLLGTDDLWIMYCEAEDEGKEVFIKYFEDTNVIEWVEIDVDEFFNDRMDVELDDTDAREARRYYGE